MQPDDGPKKKRIRPPLTHLFPKLAYLRMNKLLLILTSLAFISIAPVQAGEGGCSGCKDKSKDKTEQKEDSKS
jgi:hypothetical protein